MTPNSSTPLLQISDLHVRYGPVHAVRGISLDVYQGEIVTVIGANGAGKSSTLLSIAGAEKLSSGSITFQGIEVGGKKSPFMVSRGVNLVPEGRHIFSRLTVEENLEMGAFSLKDPSPIPARKEHVFATFPVLGERKDQLGGTLSGGEQQMLAMGRALMVAPKLLLLDEPSLGLAPLIVKTVFETIIAFRKAGTTILLVEQNANMALRHADRGYLLENGMIVGEGTGKELLVDPAVREAYLGA
ncbi:ABC transporter ATP-binding protein [bacterium]|nr:ABC transporter ATP-binding protein [bacterium]